MTLGRFFFAVFFGTLVGLVASRVSGPAAGVMAGVFSGLGFLGASAVLRERLRRRQGQPPSLGEGEKALLYGPCEIFDAQGSSKAWAYLTNQRLMLREEGGGAALDLPLKSVEELRPEGKVLGLVAQGHGLLKLKLPDTQRWLGALRSALRS